MLHGTEEEIELFEEWAHADVCPVLDLETGRCDLYASRPILCRTFGPPIRNEAGDEGGGLGMCELNFVGASEGEIAAGEMSSEFRERQAAVEREFGGGRTMVAFAFGDVREKDLTRSATDLKSDEDRVEPATANLVGTGTTDAA